MPSDGPGTHIDVREWSDIDSAPDVVDGRTKDLVAQLLREGLPHDYEHVVWLPEFKVDELDDREPELELVENSEALVVARVDDYSDKAWRVLQPHRRGEVPDHGIYSPKSWTVVFEAGEEIAIDSPQQGLGSFASSGR